MCKPALQTTHSHSVSTEDFFAGGEVAVAWSWPFIGI
jgi:hypothetical protein